MKKIQKNLRGSFNVFSNSARQLEVPLKEVQENHMGPYYPWSLLLLEGDKEIY